jgi:hypothetical protein
MPVLELTNEELQMILEIMERACHNLRVEIVNTDNREFRRELKQRETAMESMLDKMKRTAV